VQTSALGSFDSTLIKKPPRGAPQTGGDQEEIDNAMTGTGGLKAFYRNKGSAAEAATFLMERRPSGHGHRSGAGEPSDRDDAVKGAPYLFKRKIINTTYDQKRKINFMMRSQNNSAKNADIVTFMPNKYMQ